MQKELIFTTLSATGPDAESFLQGQLTCDVTTVTHGSLGAWCNPKGRVIALFFINRTADGFELILPADIADAVIRRLTMYRLRAKVALQASESTDEQLGLEDGQTTGDWLAAQLARGISVVSEEQTELFTPHMLNLDLMGGVSFDKGCYTGQEVVARTHYKGSSKRRLRRFRLESDAAPGDKIRRGDRDIGSIVNVRGSECLAVVTLTELGDGMTVNDGPAEQLPIEGLED